MLIENISSDFKYSDNLSSAYARTGNNIVVNRKNRFYDFTVEEDKYTLSQFVIRHYQSISVIAITAIFRMIILFSAYNDPRIATSAGFRLDFINHVNFVNDILNGNFFYHGNVFYSPVTPVIISIIAFPVSLINNNIVDAVIISASIFMGIKALGTFLLLQEFKQNKAISALVVIFNPWEMVGVVPWGGLSLMLSTTAVTYSFLIYRKMNKNEINATKGAVSIAIMLFLSISAHRTGIVVQIAGISLFTVFQIKSRGYDLNWLKKSLRSYKFSSTLFVLISMTIYLYYWRIEGRIEKLVVLSADNYVDKLTYLWSETLSSAPLLIVTFIGMYLFHKYRGFGIRFNNLEKGYLLMSLIFLVIPFRNNDINSRFFMVIDSLLLLFWVYLEYNIRIYTRRNVDRGTRLYVLFWVYSIGLAIGSFIEGIVRTKAYVALRVYLNAFFF